MVVVMRMSCWTPEIIRFMEDADRFTPYFSTVAALVRAVMPRGGRLCDAGCGLGQLSRELAPYAGSVDAIDASPEAIEYVRDHLDSSARRCVAPRVADFGSLHPDQAYDCMAFSLSASAWEAWRIAQAVCDGSVVVVNKIRNLMKGDGGRAESCGHAEDGGLAGRAAAPRPRRGAFAEEVLALNRAGLVCGGSEFAFEYGQPFRSLDDAQVYYGLFRDRSFPQGVSKERLESILDRTDNEAFPYYLPITRHVGVVTIDVQASRAAMGAKGLRRAS